MADMDWGIFAVLLGAIVGLLIASSTARAIVMDALTRPTKTSHLGRDGRLDHGSGA